MDIQDYQLNQEILNQEAYVLELWYYGKAGLFFISKLREINRIEEDEDPNYEIINYYNSNGDRLLSYTIQNKIFWINYFIIWSVLESEYQLNEQQIQELTKGILEQVVNCKVIITHDFPERILGANF